MIDMAEKIVKLLMDAEECELISKLATNPLKQGVYKRLADQLRLAAGDLERVMKSKSGLPHHEYYNNGSDSDA
jgi:hypothetical protein